LLWGRAFSIGDQFDLLTLLAQAADGDAGHLAAHDQVGVVFRLRTQHTHGGGGGGEARVSQERMLQTNRQNKETKKVKGKINGGEGVPSVHFTHHRYKLLLPPPPSRCLPLGGYRRLPPALLRVRRECDLKMRTLFIKTHACRPVRPSVAGQPGVVAFCSPKIISSCLTPHQVHSERGTPHKL
jgi:hypothetical protein